MNDLIYWLWFMRLEKISIRQKNLLIQQFKSPEIIFSSSKSTLKETRIMTQTDMNYFEHSKSLDGANSDLVYMTKNDIHLISQNDFRYPESLRNIYIPPIGLYAKGNLSLLDTYPKIGIVGSRKPSVSGEKYAKKFSQSLSVVGVTIVSGLASGIDGKSHWGSLYELGSTIAVLGNGIDLCYPLSNQKLFDQMGQHALIISEFNLREKPLPYHFPQRNRIISGLSQGILVIEARKKSGSLITVKHALEQGKNIYVIPGDISESNWSGSNQLLKEGAQLVTEPNDILADFIIFEKKQLETVLPVTTDNNHILNSQELNLYKLIEKGYRTIDDLVTVTSLPVQQVNSTLTMMEIEGIIAIQYGNISFI
jgi:DNA processing protein